VSSRYFARLFAAITALWIPGAPQIAKHAISGNVMVMGFGTVYLLVFGFHLLYERIFPSTNENRINEKN